MRHVESQTSFRVAEWGELYASDRALLEMAIRTRSRASAPYSHFRVGAAIRGTNNRIYTGCNVEDVAHTGTIHAEACALGSMMADFGPYVRCKAVAIALGHEETAISCPPQRKGKPLTRLSQIVFTPCGHCRTMLSQYGTKTTRILCLQPNGQILVTTILALYPAGFTF